MNVNLYIYTTVKGPWKKTGSYTYLLEYITQKGPATLTKGGTLEAVTEHQARLRIIEEAAARIRKPCQITIFTDSNFIRRGIEEWLEVWKLSGWKTNKGKPVAHREEWEKVAKVLERHAISVRVNETHSYSAWIRMETEKREKERQICLKDSENLTAQAK